MPFTDDNRFFRLVWRFNALTIAAATVLVTCIAAYAVLEQYRFRTRERHVTQTVRTDAPALTKDEWRLGEPRPLPGTDRIAIPLLREQAGNVSFYSKGSTDNIVNYFLVDTTAGNGRWLLPDNTALIVKTLWLRSETTQTAAGGEGALIGGVVEVIPRDSNTDGVLSAKDQSNILHMGVNESQSRLLLEGATDIIAIEQVSAQQFTIVYEHEGKHFAITFSSVDAKQISRLEIPGVH